MRFGLWDVVLKEAPPPEKYTVLSGVYRFAHAYALAAKGQADAADKEKAALDTYIGTLPPDLGAGFNSAKDLLAMGSHLVVARIAQARGHLVGTITLLEQAVAAEDQLAYDEPADWYVPSRHLLGAALLNAGRPQEGERVYREDLRRHPANGWALFGLAQR